MAKEMKKTPHALSNSLPVVEFYSTASYCLCVASLVSIVLPGASRERP